MAQGVKTGGRKAGVPNKDKRGLIARLAAKFPEYDPVIHLAEIANDPEADLQMRFNASKEVAKYRHPQRKAVEHTGNEGGPLIPDTFRVIHE
jgi:hypothetical protein